MLIPHRYVQQLLLQSTSLFLQKRGKSGINEYITVRTPQHDSGGLRSFPPFSQFLKKNGEQNV
jgi:hypothetical protein